MRGEVFAYQASGEGVDPSGQRGAFSPLAVCADGRQRLERAWANANFQITITTLPDHLHKLCLIPFDSSRRDLSNGVKFVKIGEKLLA